jgi:hypothetical protein
MSLKPFLALAAAILVVTAVPAVAAPAKTAADFDLIEASYGGQLPKVNQLLAKGASVDAQDQNGYTALHWAAQAGWPLTSRALLSKGAKVDARDYKGRTPLLLATVRKQVEVARTLLAAGADPNLIDQEGNSALAYARRKQMTQMVGLFVSGSRELVTLPVRAGATPRPTLRPTPRPVSHARPHPVAHVTPRAIAHASPHPLAHATPRAIAHASPHPVAHATTAPMLRPSPAVVAAADVSLGAGFREEIGRLYGLYTDHLGMRDPENLKQRGFSPELEDKLEQIFHVLDYGSAPALTRSKLQDARAWVLDARKRGQVGDADSDKVCNQLLESLDQLLAGVGF